MAPGSRLDELTAKYMQNPRRFFVPLANEYRLRGDRDRAIAVCREHLPAQPGHLSGHIVLGQAFFDKGDRPAAREAFLTAVTVDDENLIALRQLGDIARMDGDVREARQWYARVLEADPQNAEIEALLDEVSDAQDAATAAAPAPPLYDTPPAPTPAAFAAEFASPLRTSESGLISEEIPAARLFPVEDEDTPLLDPTPPGLRAITNPFGSAVVGPDAAAEAERPAAPQFERFDLATLMESDAPVPTDLPAPAVAESGTGFEYADLDSIAAPDTPAVVEVVEPWSVGAEVDAVADEPIVVHDALFTVDDTESVAEPAVVEQLPEIPTEPPVVSAGAPPLPAFLRDDSDTVAERAGDPSASAPVEPEAQPQIVGADRPRFATPSGVAPVADPAAPAADEVLSRPAFGVLASLAAWRSQQAKAVAPAADLPPAPAPAAGPIDAAPPTAPSIPVQPPFERPPTPPRSTPVRPPVFSIESDDIGALGWENDPVSQTEETSEEFTTETMAALYAQQGFLDRALSVYRALAARRPDDAALAAKVRETEAAIDLKLAEAASEDLTVNALSGLSLDGLTSSRLEVSAEAVSPDYDGVGFGTDPAEHEHLSAEYATLETIEPPPLESESWFDDTDDEIVSSLDAGGDWFADVSTTSPEDDVAEFEAEAAPVSGFAGAVAPVDASVTPISAPEVERRRAANVPLMSVFDTPLVAAPDDGAADMLSSLTEQMVGRLPKDAPTLPVPDVLELPTQGDGGEVGGATPAPLLSFDRFFAGSGGTPRGRTDDVPALPPPASPASPVSPASLSPTFGGVPVVPSQIERPDRSSAEWTVFPAGVDADARTGASAPAETSLPPLPPPDLPTWRTAEPVMTPASSAPTAGSYPAFLDPAPEAAPPESRSSSTPAPDAPAAEPSAQQDAPPPASDFHRWLEGLS